MLLNSFWVLDYTGIVAVVHASQTGSFMDGFATMIPRKTDRGNPWLITTVPLLHIQPFISNILLKTWLTCVKAFVLRPRDCELAWVHDDSTAFSSSYTLRYTSHSTLVCSHGTSRQRCRGHLGPQMQ